MWVEEEDKVSRLGKGSSSALGDIFLGRTDSAFYKPRQNSKHEQLRNRTSYQKNNGLPWALISGSWSESHHCQPPAK